MKLPDDSQVAVRVGSWVVKLKHSRHTTEIHVNMGHGAGNGKWKMAEGSVRGIHRELGDRDLDSQLARPDRQVQACAREMDVGRVEREVLEKSSCGSNEARGKS